LRCAIYTRKSTEEGLNQDFNTLEAQREAAEAYIRSQLHAGWTALTERYDDGGYTGANLERPALRRLLTDIAAGRIDCVLVYKVDRLSRSLLDFARLMEIFERHQVSLVSITQPLNTTGSLGRLTLNILLSFAEFERQMIADRTRDKMAAARRKGRWVGGTPVLGYDIAVTGGKLVVNPEEARRVQEIFALYLQHQSLDAVLDEMKVRQWTTKRKRSRRERSGHSTSTGCQLTPWPSIDRFTSRRTRSGGSTSWWSRFSSIARCSTAHLEASWVHSTLRPLGCLLFALSRLGEPMSHRLAPGWLVGPPATPKQPATPDRLTSWPPFSSRTAPRAARR